MRILKWLFHPVFLLLIIIAIVLYLNRDTVVAELSDSQEVSALLEKMDGVIATIESDMAPDSSPGEMSPVMTESTPDETAQVSVAAESPMPREEGLDDVPQAPVEPPAAQTENVAVAADVPDEPAPAVTMDAPPTNVFMPMPMQAPAPAESGGETLAEPPAVTLEQVWHTWQQARVAAWEGNTELAIEHYQTVVTLQPDNFDAYGEMGNVMLGSGDTQGAVEAYCQAAKLLSNTPHRMAAWNLLNVVARLDPQRAEELYQELSNR